MRITWIRAGDRYPDLKDDLDHFLALDETSEVGVVKWVETGPDHGWFWSHDGRRHPGPAFKRPTCGQCATRGQAAQELGACYGAFRAYYGIED